MAGYNINNPPIAKLIRTKGDGQTNGILFFGQQQIDTIELSETDENGNKNVPMKTCVLEDDYVCTYEEMHDHPGHYHYKLEDKHGRTGCFLHYIDITIPNPSSQLKGCIGSSPSEIALLEHWLPDHAPFMLRIRS